jgi:hypothetical protein
MGPNLSRVSRGKVGAVFRKGQKKNAVKMAQAALLRSRNSRVNQPILGDKLDAAANAARQELARRGEAGLVALREKSVEELLKQRAHERSEPSEAAAE